jgi:hypothetical protein
VIPKPSIRRPLVVSVVLHAIAAIAAAYAIPAPTAPRDVVDIELAPAVPVPEALPAEVARSLDRQAAGSASEPASAAPSAHDEPGDGVAAIDAGVDAAIPDARPRPDAAPRDAGIDAPIDAGIDAAIDAGIDAAPMVASEDHADAGAEPADAGEAIGSGSGEGSAVAEGSGAGSGSGSGSGSGTSSGSAAIATGSGSGSAAGSDTIAVGSNTIAVGSDAPAPGGAALDTTALAAELAANDALPGATTEPAVDGAPTTAGTAANLLAYFPAGHVVTAVIRFDRLRGTEWAAQTERLLRPMPDYHLLFGPRDAAIADKLDTLVISTPQPRDAAATTLVARTALARRPLRDFLAAGNPVKWSVSKGGLLGARTGALPATDHRVFLSPFKGWFLLAQPADLGGLTAVARGNLDTALATGALPAWLAGVRAIERETGDKRGPALVVTVAMSGKRMKLRSSLSFGPSSIPTPERASLAMELVAQGWLVRGNLRFATDADASELVATVQQLQHRVTDSTMLQLMIGKPIVRVIGNLAFARSGPRVSYATSISIADARAILALAGAQLDQYFAAVSAP